MLWREINGTLHLVFDFQMICKTYIQENSLVCLTCLEMCQVSALQLRFIWERKQDQLTRLATLSIKEPFLNASSVDKKTLLTESQSIIANQEEWAEPRRRKSMTPRTSSYSVGVAQQDAMGG